MAKLCMLYSSHFVFENCYITCLKECQTSLDLPSITENGAPVIVQAPPMKGFACFVVDFLMGGVSSAVSKTVAALIERVKLLIQNQEPR
ncbi:unnamed protein product [Cuscuta campestris]|uniref:Uncharacterized protein n=1 Tax=Cuscuta campestris TaxID=132261 RepID=A0A484KM53_9ASTE|nr:unnamed protein product [Cuscuta campestris]